MDEKLSETISVMLTKEERVWLERISQKETRSVSSQMRFILRQYVEKNYNDMMDGKE